MFYQNKVQSNDWVPVIKVINTNNIPPRQVQNPGVQQPRVTDIQQYRMNIIAENDFWTLDSFPFERCCEKQETS